MITRELLIKRTLDHLSKLPDHQIKEVSDFAEFLLNRIDDQLLTEGIGKLATEMKAYKFLDTEEDLCSVNDLKVRYK